MAKITGIGGVFFKTKTDNKALREWYKKHLGLNLEEWGGCALRWPEDRAEDQGVTVWHVAEPTTKWFSPSESSFMINYRIDNMDEMIAQLHAGGVPIHQGPEYHENGTSFGSSIPMETRLNFGSQKFGTTKIRNDSGRLCEH